MKLGFPAYRYDGVISRDVIDSVFTYGVTHTAEAGSAMHEEACTASHRYKRPIGRIISAFDAQYRQMIEAYISSRLSKSIRPGE